MKLFFLGWLVLLTSSALAQDDFYRKEQPRPTRRQYVITLQDGSQLKGELIRQDSVEAVIRTGNLGEVVVKASQIVSMVAVNANSAGKSSLPAEGYSNLFPQYLNFTPTAFSAERGRAYFRNSLVYISQFDYGITDNWSMGGAFFTFLPSALFSMATKVSVPVGDKVRLGIQGQYVAGNFFDVFQYGLSYIQGIVSIGTTQRNVTLGVGTVFSEGQLSRGKILTVGLVRKVSPALTFISENHIYIGNGVNANVSLAGGLRFDRQRHSFDLSVSLPLASQGSPTVLLLPSASYQIRMGK